MSRFRFAPMLERSEPLCRRSSSILRSLDAESAISAQLLSSTEFCESCAEKARWLSHPQGVVPAHSDFSTMSGHTRRTLAEARTGLRTWSMRPAKVPRDRRAKRSADGGVQAQCPGVLPYDCRFVILHSPAVRLERGPCDTGVRRRLETENDVTSAETCQHNPPCGFVGLVSSRARSGGGETREPMPERTSLEEH